MPKGSNQKMKILYLEKILQETDEENPLSIKDMISKLESYGITAERKSIYDDIRALRKFGINIETLKSKITKYYIANRQFELPELKLLVDAVQCSKFITLKKSTELIKKIERLSSKQQAKMLHRQVIIEKRVKSENESIYYIIDNIHTAMAQNKRVAFKYFDYNVKKEIVFRKNSEKYIVSPFALVWDNDYYYLITFSVKYEQFIHYRVDKMKELEITDINRIRHPVITDFKIEEYTKKIFGMFSGEIQKIELQFENSLVNAVIDRFGKDIYIAKVDESHFKIRTEAAVSPSFFSWLFNFGDRVKILTREVALKYKEELMKTLSKYNDIS